MIIIRKKTHEEFLKEVEEKNKLVSIIGTYINNRTKVKVKCKVCGYEYETMPNVILYGHACPKCANVEKRTNDEFVKELKAINPKIKPSGKYNGLENKIGFKCLVCGNEWKATPHSVLSGKGCAICSGVAKKTQDKFVKEMSLLHPNITVIGNYINNTTKIKCKCQVCNNEFDSSPHNLLAKQCGCPYCSQSKGERAITRWLFSNNIKYEAEYKFPDCKDTLSLPFDFYLENRRIAIEYDGKQHFEPNRFFGGKKGFEAIVRHDKIKNDYCNRNHIKLIRIPYWEFKNIDKILNTELVN